MSPKTRSNKNKNQFAELDVEMEEGTSNPNVQSEVENPAITQPPESIAADNPTQFVTTEILAGELSNLENRIFAQFQKLFTEFTQVTENVKSEAAAGISQIAQQEIAEEQKVDKLIGAIEDYTEQESKKFDSVDETIANLKKEEQQIVDEVQQVGRIENVLMEDMDIIKDELAKLQQQVRQMPLGPRNVSSSQTDANTIVRMLFPGSQLEDRDPPDPKSKPPPFLPEYVIKNSLDVNLVQHIKLIETYFRAHRLQRSLWPVAISLYLKGDLASMYNATLMKNKEALRWYDILLMIANCKDWQLYNVTQITKFNNYEPTPNQLVSDYILQARELSEQTFDYKNRFNHIRSVINGKLQPYFPEAYNHLKNLYDDPFDEFYSNLQAAFGSRRFGVKAADSVPVNYLSDKGTYSQGNSNNGNFNNCKQQLASPIVPFGQYQHPLVKAEQ